MRLRRSVSSLARIVGVMPLFIWGHWLRADDARNLVATLHVLGGPNAESAVAAIDRALNDGGGLDGLEEHGRDAVFAALEDCPEGLAELRGALLRDYEYRYGDAL